MADEKPFKGRTIHPLFIPLVALLRFGIYFPVWFYRRYSEMHRAQPDATKVSPGRAVGFLFIPFYNLYWVCYIAYDFARALGRVQAARVGRALVWPYTITILFLGGVVFSMISGIGIVGALVYFFPKDTTMSMALGAALGTIGALPGYSIMIIAQISLNRIWSEAAIAGDRQDQQRPPSSLRSYRRQLAVSLVCLVLLVATLPPLTYTAVQLKRAPTTALRLHIKWAENPFSTGSEADVSATFASLQARVERLAELGLGDTPAVRHFELLGTTSFEVLLPFRTETAANLTTIYRILTAQNVLDLKEVIAGPFAGEEELKSALPQGVAEREEVLKSASEE